MFGENLNLNRISKNSSLEEPYKFSRWLGRQLVFVTSILKPLDPRLEVFHPFSLPFRTARFIRISNYSLLHYVKRKFREKNRKKKACNRETEKNEKNVLLSLLNKVQTRLQQRFFPRIFLPACNSSRRIKDSSCLRTRKERKLVNNQRFTATISQLLISPAWRMCL